MDPIEFLLQPVDSEGTPKEDGVGVCQYAYKTPAMGADGVYEYELLRDGHGIPYCCLLEEGEPLPELVADFSADPMIGEGPLTVQFTDLSTPADQIISWDWYMGGFRSHEQNPVITFTRTGISYACYVVVSDGVNSVRSATKYVRVDEPTVTYQWYSFTAPPNWAGSPTPHDENGCYQFYWSSEGYWNTFNDCDFNKYLTAENDWQQGFRPTQFKITVTTYHAGTIYLKDTAGNTIASVSVPSTVDYVPRTFQTAISWQGYDIGRIETNIGYISINDISFYAQV